jgi:hypothetical protein
MILKYKQDLKYLSKTRSSNPTDAFKFWSDTTIQLPIALCNLGNICPVFSQFAHCVYGRNSLCQNAFAVSLESSEDKRWFLKFDRS